MNENAKAEAERIWNALKPSIESLAGMIGNYYASLGSARKCRHINQLWHSEKPVIGIGFVPPEAKERLEVLIELSGLHLVKGNGPLGHGSYFSFAYDSQLTAERLLKLGEAIEKETLQVKDAPPPKVAEPVAAEVLIEQQVARMEGLTAPSGEKIRTRPSEVGPVVDAFNGSTIDMTPVEALKLLAEAIPFLNLPDISRKELLNTVKMMQAAESI